MLSKSYGIVISEAGHACDASQVSKFQLTQQAGSGNLIAGTTEHVHLLILARPRPAISHTTRQKLHRHPPPERSPR